MAVDMFLKIDGILGESRDDKHKDEIDISSFSWGVSQTGATATGGGAGAGKAQFSDFTFTTTTSKASPQLFLACASGTHIKDATISVRKAGDGGSRQDYLVIKMNDVLVSSYQTQGASSGDRPTESINMAFAKVELTYIPQKVDGGSDVAITVGWDLKANKKV